MSIKRHDFFWVHQSTWGGEKWAKSGWVHQKTWVPKSLVVLGVVEYMCHNISSVVEFYRWWVLKSKVFLPRINILKGNCYILWIELPFVKMCQNHTFKVDFLCQKSPEFFWFFFSLMNISLGHYILLKTTLFSNIMPNFWRTGIPRNHKMQWFTLRPKILLFRTHHLWNSFC